MNIENLTKYSKMNSVLWLISELAHKQAFIELIDNIDSVKRQSSKSLECKNSRESQK